MEIERFRSWRALLICRLDPGKREQDRLMQNPYIELLLLIPSSVALAFMVWVFVMFLKASHRH
jgi:hypothetical protein